MNKKYLLLAVTVIGICKVTKHVWNELTKPMRPSDLLDFSSLDSSEKLRSRNKQRNKDQKE